MKCVECQNEIPVGSAFCPVCGSAVFEEPVAEIPEPVAEEIIEPIPVAEERPLREKIPVKKLLEKKVLKWWAAAGVCLLAVVAALVIFMRPQPGYGVYAARGSVFLKDLSGGEPVMLMEYGSCTDLMMSEDQKHLFYRASKSASQTFNLYHLDLGSSSREPEMLAAKVDQFYVNDRGTRVSYIRDSRLYVHDLKSEKFIAEWVNDFLCDEDFDTFVYSKTRTEVISSTFVSEVAWYIKDGDAEPRIIGDGRKGVTPLRFTADGKTLIYSVDDKLYAWRNNEDILIAEKAYPKGNVFEDGTFYYSMGNDAGKESFCFYDGEKSIDITAAQNARLISGTQPMLIWQESTDGPCHMAIRERILEIPLKRVHDIVLSEDGKRICVIAQDGEGKEQLYTAPVSSQGLGELQLLTQSLWGVDAWFVGGKLYYWEAKSRSEGTLYCEGEELLQDVQQYVQVHWETGTLLVQEKVASDHRPAVYMVCNGKAMMLTEEGGPPKFATNGDVLVRTNYVGQLAELWHFDQRGKGTLLAKDVTGVYVIGEARRPSSKIYWDDIFISTY